MLSQFAICYLLSAMRFAVQNGPATGEGKTRRILNGPESIEPFAAPEAAVEILRSSQSFSFQ
jgi:hypothetical protein